MHACGGGSGRFGRSLGGGISAGGDGRAPVEALDGLPPLRFPRKRRAKRLRGVSSRGSRRFFPLRSTEANGMAGTCECDAPLARGGRAALAAPAAWGAHGAHDVSAAARCCPLRLEDGRERARNDSSSQSSSRERSQCERRARIRAIRAIRATSLLACRMSDVSSPDFRSPDVRSPNETCALNGALWPDLLAPMAHAGGGWRPLSISPGENLHDFCVKSSARCET